MLEKFINLGLIPRFKWCGFYNINHLKNKLLEFVPYSDIDIKESENKLIINFIDLNIKVEFDIEKRDELNYITNIRESL